MQLKPQALQAWNPVRDAYAKTDSLQEQLQPGNLTRIIADRQFDDKGLPVRRHYLTHGL